ncbi:MAG: carbon-nitrogen hydrolase family protein [Thermofilum sp.]|nr:carbon-nitrogen hydrolase family protein [Thermofilum sp.]
MMRVALHQLVVSGSKEENLRKVLEKIDSFDADLHVFPEYLMGTKDGNVTRELVYSFGETLEGEFASKILSKSEEYGVGVVFSMYLKDNNGVSNAAVLAVNGKVSAVYRKIHLFDAYGYRESDVFARGNEVATAPFKGFTIGLAVCFDLRFPELFRAMMLRGANFFIVPSAWYKGPHKVDQWKSLTSARAHENVSFLVAVDQTGDHFAGHSLVATPMGHILVDLGEAERSLLVDIDPTEVSQAREKIPIDKLLRLDLYKVWIQEGKQNIRGK